MKPLAPLSSPLALLLLGASLAAAGEERRTENVILVTLDGARTQEIFGGLDLEVLASVTGKGKVEDTPVYKRYWAPTPRERREKLMPFFWKTLMARYGSIAGNRALGSTALISNKHRFSYPGYSEILTGEARDGVIDSNDKLQNPFPTVLERLKKELGLDARGVAAFASWDVLDAIVEHEKGAITSNCGYEPYDHPDPFIRELSALQSLAPTPWPTVRHDAYTFRFAKAHLERWKPRVLYLGLGETDDWSHDGRYDMTLDALERTDGFLRELWDLLEASDVYRGKTSIIITTDHGRGNTPADWRDHGEKTEGAQYIWIAVISPDAPRRGEWSGAPVAYQSQIAATLCAFLGIDYSAENPRAGKPLAWMLSR
jgi:hypothetical protein